MLGGLKRKVAATALASLLESLAADKDTCTTITGIAAAAVLAVPGLDLAEVIAGNPAQLARLVAALLVGTLGFLATKERADGTTTLLGTVAGAAYAAQGSVETLTTGVVIAVLGYVTNKPVQAPK